MDRLVNGAFAKAFTTEVQPVEIAAALQREVDEKAVIVGAGRTVVPNKFHIELSAADYERLSTFGPALELELAGFVREHITEQRYTTLGPITAELALDEQLRTGIFRVTASAADDGGRTDVNADLRHGPHLVMDGYIHPLTLARTVLGRGSESDIPVIGNGVSRRHCEIELSQPVRLRDLGSTNGTWVLGERITEIVLDRDTDIALGDVVVQFRLH
jgi:hypothetical protein